MRNDQRRLRDELFNCQVEQNEQKQKIMIVWKNAKTLQSLQNWKIIEKPLYAGNEVIRDLELLAIEEQYISEIAEIQSTS